MRKAPKRLGFLLAITIVLGGIQFSWALQLALLTPFIQTLGIPDTFVSYMWLCGPISGLVVQPLIGMWSDRCNAKIGRRRPFILGALALILFSQLMISNASDLGYILGDDPNASSKPHAIAFFIVGFWLLDVSNNMAMGPCRALVADLAPPDQQNLGNALFALWMAIGNVLGYGTGSTDMWATWLPFMRTPGCGVACANLRTAFTFSMIFLVLCTTITVIFAKETSLPAIRAADAQKAADEASLDTAFQSHKDESAPLVAASSAPPKKVNPFRALCAQRPSRELMMVCVVNFFSWIAWFTFLLYDTDWMGRQVFGGSPDPNSPTYSLYQQGVAKGSLGLLLNSVVSWASSFGVSPLARKIGGKWVWFASQCIFSVVMLCTLFVPPLGVAPALAIFALLGLCWTVTMAIPFAMVAVASTRETVGRDMGILNIFVVCGQLIVSFSSAPLNSAFGHIDTPSFMIGVGTSALAAVLAATLLKRRRADDEARPLLVVPAGGH